MLFTNDDGELGTFSASKDLYPFSTNFCDLPEVIYDATEENSRASGASALCPPLRARGTLDQANLLKHQLIYDENM